MKKIAVLGSTGSIGRQTLEVVDRFPDQFSVVSLTAGSNIRLLAEQVRKYRPKIVSVAKAVDIPALRSEIPGEIKITAGIEGMVEAAVFDPVDIVVTSITGTIGLIPTMESLKKGKDIALANKETLVAAGELVMAAAREAGARIMPVDSEHSAIFQCLNGENRAEVNRLVLTASGGPFFHNTRDELQKVTVEDALKHPNWAMGRKITIDSATMMNKGLEVIEARWLFDIEISMIDVLIHPQSIVHSMVEFRDGSVIAQMGVPDMRIPIQYALSYPNRWDNGFPRLNFLQVGELTFAKPRADVFPSLELAFAAAKAGGTMPAVMNAANEKAVHMFLDGTIKFLDIPVLVERVMANHKLVPRPGLGEILDSDAWAREEAERLK